MVIALLEWITSRLKATLRRMETWEARHRHPSCPPPHWTEGRLLIGKVFYVPCPCETDSCLCRMLTREGAPCPDCGEGLHIFDAFDGNPMPHRKRAPDLPCDAHGEACIWASIVDRET